MSRPLTLLEAFALVPDPREDDVAREAGPLARRERLAEGRDRHTGACRAEGVHDRHDTSLARAGSHRSVP